MHMLLRMRRTLQMTPWYFPAAAAGPSSCELLAFGHELEADREGQVDMHLQGAWRGRICVPGIWVVAMALLAVAGHRSSIAPNSKTQARA